MKLISGILKKSGIVAEREYTAAEIRNDLFSRIDSRNATNIESTEDTLIGERLSRLGFTNAKDAIESTQKKEKSEQLKKERELVSYYSQEYPFNKFIVEGDITAIAKKYGLLFGEASKYIGEIPEDCLRQIESFKMKEKDVPAYYHGLGVSMMDKESENLFFKERATSDEYVNIPYRHIHESDVRLLGSYTKETKLSMLAPANMFRLNSWEKIENNRIVTKDPIVFVEVRGGYLVLAAWVMNRRMLRTKK